MKKNQVRDAEKTVYTLGEKVMSGTERDGGTFYSITRKALKRALKVANGTERVGYLSLTYDNHDGRGPGKYVIHVDFYHKRLSIGCKDFSLVASKKIIAWANAV